LAAVSQCPENKEPIVTLNIHRPGRVIGVLVLVLGAALTLSGCNWEPRVMHPDMYASGKVMPGGKVEVAAGVIPGASIDLGLGGGMQLHAYGGYTGDDIYAGELGLTRSLVTRRNVYSSLCVGYGLLWADDHEYNARRAHLGHTVSVYTKNERFALHLPLKVYWLEYDWTRPVVYPDEPSRLRDDGIVVVPGIGGSIQGEHAALRLGMSVPLREDIGRTELFPALGAQVAVRF
jgi:hypothetical protein